MRTMTKQNTTENSHMNENNGFDGKYIHWKCGIVKDILRQSGNSQEVRHQGQICKARSSETKQSKGQKCTHLAKVVVSSSRTGNRPFSMNRNCSTNLKQGRFLKRSVTEEPIFKTGPVPKLKKNKKCNANVNQHTKGVSNI